MVDFPRLSAGQKPFTKGPTVCDHYEAIGTRLKIANIEQRRLSREMRLITLNSQKTLKE